MLFCFSSLILAGKNAENLFLDNHKYNVKYPDNVPAKQQTQDTRNDFALLNSGDDAANQRSNRDDCKYYAYYVAKTKVIALFLP